MVVEAVVAFASGVRARSVSLIAFGADSLIELVSAGVLIWRFNLELRRGRSIAEMADRSASRIGGALLLVLAAYIGACGHPRGRVLLAGSAGQSRGDPDHVDSVASEIAGRQGHSESRALRAGAVESITCGWLPFVVVIGLLAQLALGAWWIDAVTSLVIVGAVDQGGSRGLDRGGSRRLSE